MPITNHIWTDGSLRSHTNNSYPSGGFAFIIDMYYTPHKLEGSGSMYIKNHMDSGSMELVAVLLGLLHIHPSYRHHKTQVYSDYEQLKIMMKNPDKDIENSRHRHLYEAIFAVANTFSDVSFYYTRGHSSKKGNERANTLAQKASKELAYSNNGFFKLNQFRYEELIVDKQQIKRLDKSKMDSLRQQPINNQSNTHDIELIIPTLVKQLQLEPGHPLRMQLEHLPIQTSQWLTSVK